MVLVPALPARLQRELASAAGVPASHAFEALAAGALQILALLAPVLDLPQKPPESC